MMRQKQGMFSQRSNKQELMDDLMLSDSALEINLNELDTYNHLLGGKKVLFTALNKILKRYPTYFKQHTITIADLGCGSGELLRSIQKWAQNKQISVKLIGVDANPHIITVAEAKSCDYPNIEYQCIDIFSEEFKALSFDIITINSVTHHFDDTTLIKLFKQINKQATLAVLINDLQRHWLSYFFIKAITSLFNYSYLAKHDAPLSVLRAFYKKEIRSILKRSQIKTYQIRWAWAFRWEVIIWT